MATINNNNKDKGEESMKDFMTAQNNINSINSNRLSNLQEERTVLGMQANNNAELSQAAALMASGGSSQPVQMHPSTKAALAKFGLGQPRQINTKASNITKTPNNITVNNNTNNITNNNVQLAQPNIPMKQSDNSNKVTAWLNNVFARQNQQAALREKEYQRREWSLSREANKMMRKIESIGKTMIHSLNPKRIGNAFTSELKTTLVMFGTYFLVKHWKRVMEIASSINNRLLKIKDWFVKEDGFEGRVIKLLGGEKGESVGTAFKNLFSDLGDRIVDKLDMLFKSRSDAMKAVKFPEINLGDINGTLKGIGVYISDILKAMTGGPTAIKESVTNSVKSMGVGTSNDEKDKSKSMYYSATHLAYGADKGSSVLLNESTKKRLNSLLPGSVKNGELTNKAYSSISQSLQLSNLISKDASEGKINTGAVAGGLSRLRSSAERNKMVPIDSTLLGYLSKEEIEKLKQSGDIKNKPYKVIVRDKENSELPDKFSTKLLKEAGTTAIIDKVGDSYMGNTAAGWARATDPDDMIFRSLGEYGNYIADFRNASKSSIKRFFSNKKVLDIVPYDTPGETPKSFLVGDEPERYMFSTVNAKVIDAIINKIVGKKTKLDVGNREFMTDLQTSLEKRADKNGAEKKVYDYDITKAYENLDEIIKKDYERELKYKQEHSNDRIAKSGKEIARTAKNAYLEVGSMYNSAANLVQEYAGFNLPRIYSAARTRRITESESRANSIKALQFLMMNGFTEDQAAGIVGVLNAESGMNPGIHNPESPKNQDNGIAQWCDERFDNLKKFYKSTTGETARGIEDIPLETQLQFMLSEMKARPAFMKEMHGANSVAEATDIMLRGFENGGPNKLASKEEINKTYSKFGHSYETLLMKRISLAKGSRELFNSPEYFNSINSTTEGGPKLLPEETKMAYNNWADNNTGLKWSNEAASPLLTADGYSSAIQPEAYEVAGSNLYGADKYSLTSGDSTDGIFDNTKNTYEAIIYQTSVLQQLSNNIYTLAANSGNTIINNTPQTPNKIESSYTQTPYPADWSKPTV